MKYFSICLFIVIAPLAFSQNSPYTEVLNYYQTHQHFNGTVLVAKEGKIEFLDGTGLANRDSKAKITNNSTFRIASITKAFTAVLILQLYEKGKLELNVPFGKYFPSYKGNAKNVATIENLLTYSSGIPDKGAKLDMKPYEKQLKLDDFINLYCSEKIVDKPGEKSIYSNVEYIILSKIIENITKKPYERVLQEQILTPLKMTHSGMIHTQHYPKGLVTSYSVDDSTKVITKDKPYFAENYFGAGAMYSTAEDLFKFDQGIFQEKLLKPATTKLLLKPNPKLGNVAFGVWYADGYGTFSKPFIYRTGGILGASSNWIHSLEDQTCILVLNNTNGTNLFGMSEQLYLVSKGEKPTIK
jgi:CubicO group peptidase (beta-lactamase class C family)